MMRLGLSIIVMIWTAMSVYAGEIETIWPELQKIEVDQYEQMTMNVYYHPDLATLINEDITDPDAQIYAVRILQTRLSPNDPTMWVLVYNEGPSVDPEFTLYKEVEGEEVEMFREWGLTIVIPGDGYVYVAGHTNNMFDQRKKFAYQGDQFKEVKQPFYYVGITTTVREESSLYADMNEQELVAVLPQGAMVEVLVNSGDYYLVKTDYGLVGWLKEHVEDAIHTQMEGIYYAGD